MKGVLTIQIVNKLIIHRKNCFSLGLMREPIQRKEKKNHFSSKLPKFLISIRNFKMFKPKKTQKGKKELDFFVIFSGLALFLRNSSFFFF